MKAKQQQEKGSRFDFNKEKIVLFLIIATTLLLLIKWPQTFNLITGAGIASESMNEQSYYFRIIGSLAAVVLIVTLWTSVRYFLKKKKLTESNLPLPEETPAEWKKNWSWDKKLEHANRKIKQLRREQELPGRKINRIIKLPNINEQQLERELNKVNTKIQGYAQPTVIKYRQQKQTFNNDLAEIEKSLSELNKVNNYQQKKIKVIRTIPPRFKDTNLGESEKLKKEITRIASTLFKGMKNSSYFLKDILPKHNRKRELSAEKKAIREVKRISRKIEGKNPRPISELREIENKLAKIKSKK